MIFPNVVYHVFFNEPPKFLENSSHHCLSGTWKVVGRCRIGCLEGTQASYPPRICCLIGQWFAWLICWLDGWWFVFFDGLRCFWFHWFGCVVLSWDDEVPWILSLNHPTWCSPPGPNVQNKLPQIDHDVSPLKGEKKHDVQTRLVEMETLPSLVGQASSHHLRLMCHIPSACNHPWNKVTWYHIKWTLSHKNKIQWSPKSDMFSNSRREPLFNK